MPTDRQRRSLLKKFGDAIRRLLGRKPSPPPADPYAYAMAPVRRGPKGRSGAAVAEIERSSNDDSYRSFPPRG
jgi:hypothetical protein